MPAASTPHSLGREPGRLAEGGVRAIAAIVLAGAVGLIAWQLSNDANPDATTVGAFLLAVIATLGIAYPKSFISLGRQITNVNAFGITVELRVQEAKEAIAQFDSEEDGVDVELPTWPRSNRKALAMVAEELRRKLRFVSEAVLGAEQGIPEELIIDNLGNAGLLPFNEVRLCRDLLADAYRHLDELDDEERKDFLDRIWIFAYRFATRMFDREARKRLSGGEWKLANFSQRKGHRADFIAARDGLAALIAARVAAPPQGVLGTAGRLADVDFPLPDLKRLVVVPDHVNHLWEEIDKGPMRVGSSVLVVRLGRLVADPDLAKRDPLDLPEAT